MLDIHIATPQEIQKLSVLSVDLGNVPLTGEAVLATNGDETVGFAAVNREWHAAGSWVKASVRRQGLTYEMRRTLDARLREIGAPFYFALPNTEFERQLFAKYGSVTERIAQVRYL